MASETIVRFNEVSFEFGYEKPILIEADFSIRSGTKIALMGQNGAGKSTIFQLITGALKPQQGDIFVDKGITVATAHQVISRDHKDLTVEQFFGVVCPDLASYELRSKIAAVLTAVNLKAPFDKVIQTFSGGQQARLLLAQALIQNPDLLLLDEPTNNLDRAGIEHLTAFLMMYEKSCLVISHDADFLNMFTDGVLYLDVYTHKVEQYAGNYYDVVTEIAARIEKQQSLNARMEKEIIENKEKANFFAFKGGKMRLVARKMRERAEELEEEKVDVRKEDKTIRSFTIPAQPDLVGNLVDISSYTVIIDHQPVVKQARVVLNKKRHLLIAGPNGIGKSTFIESLANGTAKGAVITPGVKVGYYRQDFSTLNFDETVYESLKNVAIVPEQDMRSVAAGFLITSELMKTKIGNLSEGQKGLVSFARLVLLKPGLLILDEPTNHINFRHLPIIAAALDSFDSAMILVSHVPEFVSQIHIDDVLDLEK